MTPDMIWRCDITGNPVGTDTRMIGAPPCDCQGCRAADHIASLEAALAPFAEWAAKLEQEFGDHADDVIVGGIWGATVTFGQLRRAARALDRGEG